MYNGQYTLDNLYRIKEQTDNMINNYHPTQPINNFFNTQTPSKTFIEWRILNENEEVDNLYVQNKTLFINDNTMILKDVDGKLEKWEIKKIYPIDAKDKKINDLEEQIKKLKEEMYELSKPNEPIDDVKQPDGNVNGNVKPKPKANDKPISKQE